MAVGWVAIGVLASVAMANGDDTHGVSYDAVVRGGGVVSEGVGLAQRFGDSGIGEVEISEIPVGAVVVQAWLHWVVHGDFDDTILLTDIALGGGQSVLGDWIGTAGDTCWGIGDNHVYRADVTAYVAGNGTYRVTGLPGAVDGDGMGASLTVVYEDASSSDLTQIVLSDGAILVVAPGSHQSVASWSTPVGGPIGRVRAHYAVSDGQGADDGALLFEDVEIAVDPWQGGGCLSPGYGCPLPEPGGDGEMWDDDTYDLSADGLIAEGATEATTTLEGGSDCVVFVAFTVEITYPDPCDDSDGDGVTTCDGDCDDTDALRYPGAPELCDARDNDCDAEVDEDVATADWYPDADGDGFGDDGADPVSDCMVVPGSVNNAADCDDSDPDVSPLAEERCGDGVDGDCDGVIDGLAECGPVDQGDPDPDADADAASCGGCLCATGAAGSGVPVGLWLLFALVRRGRSDPAR